MRCRAQTARLAVQIDKNSRTLPDGKAQQAITANGLEFDRNGVLRILLSAQKGAESDAGILLEASVLFMNQILAIMKKPHQRVLALNVERQAAHRRVPRQEGRFILRAAMRR